MLRKAPLCLLVALFYLSGFAVFSAQSQESDGILKIDPKEGIKLKVVKMAAVYGTPSLNVHVKNFLPDDEVLLEAYSPTALQVRNLKTDYSGWVSPDSLSPLDPDLIASIKAKVEEEKVFAQAIKDEKVLPGMSFEHVKEALGKASTETFRTDENGRFDTWSYIEYENQYERRQVVDPYTRLVTWQTYRVKVPVGSLNVEFKNGRVTAIEKTSSPNAGLKR